MCKQRNSNNSSSLKKGDKLCAAKENVAIAFLENLNCPSRYSLKDAIKLSEPQQGANLGS